MNGGSAMNRNLGFCAACGIPVNIWPVWKKNRFQERLLFCSDACEEAYQSPFAWMDRGDGVQLSDDM